MLRNLILIVLLAVISFNFVLLSVPDPILFVVCWIAMTALYAGLMYVNVHVLVTRFLLKSRYISYFFSLLGGALLMVGVELLVEYIMIYVLGFSIGEYSHFSKNKYLVVNILSTVCVYGIAIAGTSFTVLLQHWMSEGSKVLELEKTVLQSKVEALKNQISPQFLFSTLDKARLLTKESPESASQILIDLSKFLRYQLYDSSRYE
jgi:sensor histidine kinase YesM